MDDFSTGTRANLADVGENVGAAAWARFEFSEADIRDSDACRRACEGTAFVLHQAALGSVPRSIADPVTTHAVNVDGFLNVTHAAREAGCERLVYASSSSVYGDRPGLPKREENLGQPLSPYAATKRIDEIYAATFARTYQQQIVGLRYFNVFGPRQDPRGPYAAVIPRWIEMLLSGGTPRIYGDGETSRDFCPVANVVQANLLAALAPPDVAGRVYNVALGESTTLKELFLAIRGGLAELGVDRTTVEPMYEDFRTGDVRHSQADLALAGAAFGYEPVVDFAAGIRTTLEWFEAVVRDAAAD